MFGVNGVHYTDKPWWCYHDPQIGPKWAKNGPKIDFWCMVGALNHVKNWRPAQDQLIWWSRERLQLNLRRTSYHGATTSLKFDQIWPNSTKMGPKGPKSTFGVWRSTQPCQKLTPSSGPTNMMIKRKMTAQFPQDKLYHGATTSLKFDQIWTQNGPKSTFGVW